MHADLTPAHRMHLMIARASPAIRDFVSVVSSVGCRYCLWNRYLSKIGSLLSGAFCCTEELLVASIGCKNVL